jgi:hypothetical protein
LGLRLLQECEDLKAKTRRMQKRLGGADENSIPLGTMNLSSP